MTSIHPILVIGIGNDYRRDDAVGLYVARKIREKDLDGVKVIDGISDGTSLIDAWEHAARVYFIDGTISGSLAGKIFRFDGLNETIPHELFPPFSTHAINVADAVRLAETLGQFPPSLIIFGIEGKNFEAGYGLAEAVQSAAEEVIGRIIREIEELGRNGH
ncbi:MAG: hydrogenase maturation protease [Candidatus Zixiibacteriota bacterium]|nr:MAG: hydrogenase maturation protease [candidate division Zixibacteria bacterium]